LSNIYNVFYVSQLQNYILDPSYVIELNDLQLTLNLTYEPKHVQIIDHSVKTLKNKTIHLMEVF